MLGVVWFIRLAVALFNPASRSGVGRNLLRWAVPPLIGILVLALPAVGDLKKSRFALSAESFETVARSAVAGSVDWKMGPGNVGAVRCLLGRAVWNTVRFALAGGRRHPSAGRHMEPARGAAVAGEEKTSPTSSTTTVPGTCGARTFESWLPTE